MAGVPEVWTIANGLRIIDCLRSIQRDLALASLDAIAAARRRQVRNSNMPVAQRVDGWVDVHAHFSTPKTPEELKSTVELSRFGCFLMSEPFEWTPELALDHMDRWGIAMQLLSNIPKTTTLLRESNDFGAELVKRYPSRFGLLAALPTHDPAVALEEIGRADIALSADGFAVTSCYNGVYLSDQNLWPVWAELDRRKAAVFIHPDAYAPPSMGRPSALLEVAFDTTRTVVDMLYAGLFRDFPNIRFVIAHCGAALPALSGRLALLGARSWVPNPRGVASDEIKATLAKLFYDTAATASPSTLRPVLTVAGKSQIVYGSDCGVPCSNEATLSENLQSLLAFPDLEPQDIDAIGRNAATVFPSIAERLAVHARAHRHSKAAVQ
jgi:6-methylsalicylate decarboxylase